VISGSVFAETFEVESKKLAGELKSSLVKNLTEKINTDGVESAIPFCHENVKTIAKAAAKDYLSKYEFGRSSHKIRNTSNNALDWMKPYIDSFTKVKFDKAEINNYGKYGTLPNGKRVYVEPLFIQAQCLSCHGESVSTNVSVKINELYPNDKATGFKLNEFRGIVWIKEK
jgi:hypothetical protein